MKKSKTIITLAAGILIGATIAGPASAAEGWLKATPSAQRFFVNGQRVELTAYAIEGYNYVKLRDIGEVVGFDVAYDATTNSVYIGSKTDSTEAKGGVILPADVSRYIPQAGGVIRCDDGTDYTITDVSRWDANMFAEGPLPDLPTPTCDWSLLDRLQLPEVEARHYTVGGKDYLFLRNLYETRRMQYTLYNAIGADDQTWQNGAPVLRKDGSQLVRIHLSIPSGTEPHAFWPWREENITELFHSCPPGDYYMEAWDVYKDGIFQRTEYNIAVK